MRHLDTPRCNFGGIIDNLCLKVINSLISQNRYTALQSLLPLQHNVPIDLRNLTKMLIYFQQGRSHGFNLRFVPNTLCKMLYLDILDILGSCFCGISANTLLVLNCRRFPVESFYLYFPKYIFASRNRGKSILTCNALLIVNVQCRIVNTNQKRSY